MYANMTLGQRGPQLPLTIDSSRCQGHGRCSLVSPKIFDITDDGLGQVLVPEPGPGDAADVARAIDNCPESAISFAVT
jgi:ferredoxin